MDSGFCGVGFDSGYSSHVSVWKFSGNVAALGLLVAFALQGSRAARVSMFHCNVRLWPLSRCKSNLSIWSYFLVRSCSLETSDTLTNWSSQTRCWRSLIIVVFDSPYAEKYMSIVLAMEAGEGSGHSRRSRHFTLVFARVHDHSPLPVTLLDSYAFYATGNLDSPHSVFEFCTPVEVNMNVVFSFFCSCVSQAVNSLLTGLNDDFGILSWLGVVGLKRTWVQKLTSGLLLRFMTTPLFQIPRRVRVTSTSWLRMGRRRPRPP